MKTICLFISSSLFFCYIIHAQQNAVFQSIKPRHFLTISKFQNGNSKPFAYSRNVYLRLHGQLVFPNDSSGKLTFNNLSDTDTIDLVIKSGREVFSLKKIAGWYFRDGAHVAIGTIPKVWKLKSIAEQDDYLPTNTDYDMWSKRYRIAPEGTTIDLAEITRLKNLTYVTCCSYSGQCIMTYRVARR